MKSVVPVVICVLLLIGGSMLMAPAAVTTSVPVTYVVVAPAPPIPQGEMASPQPPVVQPGIEVKKIPDGLLPHVPVIPPLDEQLAALGRVGPVCPPGGCPSIVNPNACVPVNACDAVATAGREIVLGRPLRAVAQAGCAVGRVVKTVIGRERRVARREARRGG